ncbi:unnamed protein product [Protopolystoma xenopodis]|uniref:Uncharacterized protein n=1 Tax=Protopolystoma xenopodis TaxID=117903 RepID=A0A3S5C8X5_9PLAT|nr:unnamed protein product [Protopolystoma xenopodis]
MKKTRVERISARLVGACRNRASHEPSGGGEWLRRLSLPFHADRFVILDGQTWRTSKTPNALSVVTATATADDEGGLHSESGFEGDEGNSAPAGPCLESDRGRNCNPVEERVAVWRASSRGFHCKRCPTLHSLLTRLTASFCVAKQKRCNTHSEEAPNCSQAIFALQCTASKSPFWSLPMGYENAKYENYNTGGYQGTDQREYEASGVRLARG